MDNLTNRDLIAICGTIQFRMNDIERKLRKNKNLTEFYISKLHKDLKHHDSLYDILHSKVGQNINNLFKDVEGTALAIWIHGADINIRLWNAFHDYLKYFPLCPVEYFDYEDHLYALPNVGEKGVKEFKEARENYPSYDIDYFEIARWLEA